jgi:acetolactate synthase-1/3 small subunit
MRHTISVLVENHFGVLARVAGLFSGRGFNISSLSVGETEDPSISRMTLVVEGDDAVVEQIKKQLNKLIEVLKVVDLAEVDHVGRELALVKVNAEKRNRSEIIELVDIFRAGIIDVSPKSMTIEVTGPEEKVAALIKMLKPFGIREMARTGRVALPRA